jgi:spore coat protein U-like protein
MNRVKIAVGAVIVLAVAVTITIRTARAATLSVSATVVRACNIQDASLNFNNYDPVGVNNASPLDATTTIIVTCTQGTNYSVALGNGGNFSAGSRRMASGGNFLPYGLYSDSTHTTVWNDTTSLVTNASASGILTPNTHTVYGRIPAGQDVPAGSYSDSVTSTVIINP